MGSMGMSSAAAAEPILLDLGNFGHKVAKGAFNFRWPTVEDIKNMGLTEPLKLKEIRTRGAPKDSLSAIQLVYTNGAESPLFDTKYAPAGPLESV